MVKDPSGRLSEAKVWANAYKGAGLVVLVNYADKVLSDWMLLAVLLLAGIAPDVMKKLIVSRTGGLGKKE